jgi:ABC-2 type transport system permease protein
MTRYLWLESLRAVRDVRYLVLAVASPVGFYLLFTNLFGAHGEMAEGLPQPVELMVAMAAYGAMWSVFSATAPRIAQEREIGWSRQLRVTPLPARAIIGSKVISSLAAALPAMVLVCLTAALVNGVRLDASEWAAMLAAMWVGTLPLTLLGFAIGYLAGADVAYGVVMVLYFALGALGGLWMPLAMLPETLRDVGQALPTNRLADLGWKLAAGQTPATSSVLILAAWTAGFGLLALIAYRRTTGR